MTKYAYPRTPLRVPDRDDVGQRGMETREWLLGQCLNGFAASLIEVETPLLIAQVDLIADNVFALLEAFERKLPPREDGS